MQKRQPKNINSFTLPVIGEEFDFNGHSFLVSDVKQRVENGNHVVEIMTDSTFLKSTTTFTSELPLFKLDDCDG